MSSVIGNIIAMKYLGLRKRDNIMMRFPIYAGDLIILWWLN
jgi:hypothetical protein